MIVIMATSRCGTTFLVELFTHIDFDAGFSKGDLAQLKDPNARAEP